MIDTTNISGSSGASLRFQTAMNEESLVKDDATLSMHQRQQQASLSFANIRDSIKSIPSSNSLSTASITDLSDSSSDASDTSANTRLDDVRGIVNDDQIVPPPPPPPRESRLSWGTVQIREYNRTVGDHPEVAYGPPLSLDWDYNELDVKELDDYEENRAPKKRFLRMTSLTRRNLLHNEFQIPEEDLFEAEKQARMYQKKREQSNRQSSFTARAEDRLQSAKRKIKRRFSKDVIFSAMAAASGPFMGMNGMMNSMSMASPMQI